ncbi:MAG: hypothetical protein NZ899_14940 [Thermoguttaceae bacterium]|nr:hypothetical protein [Thermoguttaceae bacterium]MDW8078147.1 hypothetical protein [Thermoguttaceae bacterium]
MVLFVEFLGHILAVSAISFGPDWRGPRPGDVYKEFVIHNVGDRAWRVTNPRASHPGAKKYLPNPVWQLEIDDLSDAIRAEVILDRWGGHLYTINPRIRFNGHDWIPVDPPIKADGAKLSSDYYFQDNPLIVVPLEYLKVGTNLVEGTCDHLKEDGWGQWGLYALMLRVYYDPAKKPAGKGRIVAPRSGQTITENPLIVVETEHEQVDRVDIFAYYYGYDENGDGRFLDWHGGWFKPFRDAAPQWQGHVGTLTDPPFRVVWETRWVPDQPPGQIALVARIRSKNQLWSVTEVVNGLTVGRVSERVSLYPAVDFPPEFGVRAGERRLCIIKLPADYQPQSVVEASLHYRTWHGWDQHHAPYRLNEYQRAHEGKNHHYHYHIHEIPASALRPGENSFEIFSQTEHHMLEVLWPGPALIIRWKR